MPGGRPRIVITEQHIKRAEQMAAKGGNMEQIASVLGISVATLYKKKNEYSEFLEAIERGKWQGKAVVETVMFKMATSGKNYPATRDYLAKRFPDEWGDKAQGNEALPAKIEVEVVKPKPKSRKAPAKKPKTKLAKKRSAKTKSTDS